MSPPPHGANDAFPRWCAGGLGTPWNLREVAPGLYVGSIADVRNPEWFGVGRVRILSLTEEHEAERLLGRIARGDHEETIGTEERVTVEMVDGRQLELPRIDRAANQVLAWRAEGVPTPVLIRCYAGASRSAAVAYAVLRAEGMDDGEALRRVRRDAFSPRPWAIDAARLWVTHRPCE